MQMKSPEGFHLFNLRQFQLRREKSCFGALKIYYIKKKTSPLKLHFQSRSFIGLIKQARELNYAINLVYYWLDSVELAIERVKTRVSEGGHHIPTDTIIRRYYAGLRNFINLYRDRVDYWMLIDNSQTEPLLIAEGTGGDYRVISEVKCT